MSPVWLGLPPFLTGTGAYANSTDYVKNLIRKDQENRNKLVSLQKAVAEGLESGMNNKSFDEIIGAAKLKLQNGL